MSRFAKSKGDPLGRAEALLRNPAAATAAELLQLVHQINPTGHRFMGRDSSVRYQLKSALQSVLVERFDEDLVLERTKDPRVVGIRHRYLGIDGCHAILDELSVDARSRLLLRLDTEDDGVEVAESSSLRPGRQPNERADERSTSKRRDR